MTWAFAELSQLLTVFFATLKSFKLLKAISLKTEEEFFEDSELLTASQDALMFWSIFAVWRIYLYLMERWLRWIPGYYYLKAAYMISIAFPQLRIMHVVFYDVLAPSVERLEYEVLKYEKYFTPENLIDFGAKLPFIIIFILCPWILDDPTAGFERKSSAYIELDSNNEKTEKGASTEITPETSSEKAQKSSIRPQTDSEQKSYLSLKLSRIRSRFTMTPSKKDGKMADVKSDVDTTDPVAAPERVRTNSIDSSTPVTPDVYSKMMDSKRRLAGLTSKYDFLDHMNSTSDQSRRGSVRGNGKGSNLPDRKESRRWSNMVYGKQKVDGGVGVGKRGSPSASPQSPSSRQSIFEFPTAKKYIKAMMMKSPRSAESPAPDKRVKGGMNDTRSTSGMKQRSDSRRKSSTDELSQKKGPSQHGLSSSTRWDTQSYLSANRPLSMTLRSSTNIRPVSSGRQSRGSLSGDTSSNVASLDVSSAVPTSRGSISERKSIKSSSAGLEKPQSSSPPSISPADWDGADVYQKAKGILAERREKEKVDRDAKEARYTRSIKRSSNVSNVTTRSSRSGSASRSNKQNSSTNAASSRANTPSGPSGTRE
jgi:hypothetical protein